MTQAPMPIRELRPETPKALADLVMQLLEKRPAARPESADHVLRVLEGINVSSADHPRMLNLSGARLRFAALAAVCVVLLGAAVFVWRARSGGGASKDRSIAVLPLRNLSGDPANDYFGEGLGEEITGALAKAGLKVIGRGSARALVAKGVDARSIARELGVSTVLEGTVQRAGDRVRISVTLMSASDGVVMWTEKFDRQITDIFAVQDEIARSVAKELHATLVGGEGTKLVRNETSDPEAHSLYLQGMYLWNRRTAPAIRQAIGLFEEAAKRDPNYARARAGIGLAYVALAFYEDTDTDSLLTLSRASAQKALAADSTLTEAWTASGFADNIQWKNASAEIGFARAVAVDSTFATAHFWRGLFLMHTGRPDEARREITRAIELEPVSIVIRTGLGQLETSLGHYKESESILRRALALDSTSAVAKYSLSASYIEEGRYPEAIGLLEQLIPLPGVRSIELRSALAEAYARAGRGADARRIIADVERTGAGHVSGALASALMALGERDRAIAVLRSALDQHDPWLPNFARTARYNQLRADKDGGALLARSESR